MLSQLRLLPNTANSSKSCLKFEPSKYHTSSVICDKAIILSDYGKRNVTNCECQFRLPEATQLLSGVLAVAILGACPLICRNEFSDLFYPALVVNFTYPVLSVDVSVTFMDCVSD